MNNKYEDLTRTYVNEKHTSDWEILSDDGFVSINSVLLTDPYLKYVIKTSLFDLTLECADDHIVYSSDDEEYYAKDLKPGDLIKTEFGLDIVKSVTNTGILENMYDIHVNSDKHRLYSGHILCHNSLVLSNVGTRAAKLGSNVGVFTVELGDRKYVKRLGANLLDIPNSEYSQFVDDASYPYIQRKIDDYKKQNPNTGCLHVKEFPTGSVSPIDMENYFLKYQEMHGLHLDLIVVDYINLLKPHKGNDTMYERIKGMAEQLRAIAQRNNWCIVTATQVKMKDFSTELHMDSAAESSGLIATLDSMFGLMGEPGSNELIIKNLANRDAGYMESYKKYNKDHNHFRVVEKNEADSEFYSDDFAGNLIEQVHKEDAERRTAIEQQAQIVVPVDEQLIDSFKSISPNLDFYGETPVIVSHYPKDEIAMEINKTNPVPYTPIIIDIRSDDRPVLIVRCTLKKIEEVLEVAANPSTAGQPIASEAVGVVDLVSSLLDTPAVQKEPKPMNFAPYVPAIAPAPPPQYSPTMDEMLNNALGIGKDIPIPPEIEARLNIRHDDILKNIKI